MFIPEEVLYTLMTRQLVDEVCRTCGFPKHQLEEISEAIFDGMRKTFAVLVLISEVHSIQDFIGNDQLLAAKVDDRLPLSMDAIGAIDSKIASAFYHQQWEFCAPHFSGRATH